MYCKFCNKVFASSYGLKNHEATHAGRREKTPEDNTPRATPADKDVPYRCRVCSENFQNLSDLERHREQCRVLLMSDDTPTDHRRQQNTVIETRNTLVETTSNMNTVRTFGAAVEIDIPDDEPPVEEIASVNTRPVNRQRPTRKPRELNCKECGEHFLSYVEWCRHKRTHVIYKCDDCGRIFGRRNHLNRHIAGPKKYPCETCGKCFGSRNCIAYHRKNTSCRDNNNTIQVVKCRKKGNRKKVVGANPVQQGSDGQKAVGGRGDEVVYRSPKEFSSTECSECKAILKDAGSFSYHIQRRGSGAKSKCRYCDKWFRGKPCLIHHEITHIKDVCVAVEHVNHDHLYSSCLALRPPTMEHSTVKFANRPIQLQTQGEKVSATVQRLKDTIEKTSMVNTNTVQEITATVCKLFECEECNTALASEEILEIHKRDHAKRKSVGCDQMAPNIVTDSSPTANITKPRTRKRYYSRWIPIAPKVVCKKTKPGSGESIQIEERDGEIVIHDGVQNKAGNATNVEIKAYASQEVPCDPESSESSKNRIFQTKSVPKFMILKVGGKTKTSGTMHPTQSDKPKNSFVIPRRLLPRVTNDKALPFHGPRENMVTIQNIVPGQLIKNSIGGVDQFFRFDPKSKLIIPAPIMQQQPNTTSTVSNMGQTCATPNSPKFTILKVNGAPQGTSAVRPTQNNNQKNISVIPRTLLSGSTCDNSSPERPGDSTNNVVTIQNIAPGQIIKINIEGVDQLFRFDSRSKSMVPLLAVTKQSYINQSDVNQAKQSSQSAIHTTTDSICVQNAPRDETGQDNPDKSSALMTGKDASPIQIEEPRDNLCEVVTEEHNPRKSSDEVNEKNARPTQIEEPRNNSCEVVTEEHNTGKFSDKVPGKYAIPIQIEKQSEGDTNVSNVEIPNKSRDKVPKSSHVVDNGNGIKISQTPVAPKFLVVQVNGKTQGTGAGDSQNKKNKSVFVIPSNLLSQSKSPSDSSGKSGENVQSKENVLTMQNIAAGQVIKISVGGVDQFFRFDQESKSMVPVTVATQQPTVNQAKKDSVVGSDKSHNKKKTKNERVPGIYQCSICQKVLSSLGALKEHEKTHSANRTSYSCSSCEKTFISRSGFQRHQAFHEDTSKEKCKCDICGKQLSSLSNLRDHKRTLHGPRKMQKCDTCDREFTSQTGLKYHQSTHTGNKRKYSCHDCGKCFTGSSGLKYHKKQQPEEGVSFKCATCDKEFAFKTCLKHHEKSHDAQQQLSHKFDQCAKEVSSPSAIKYQKITYANGKKVFKCDECDKVLSSLPSMKYHKRSHAQEKLKHKCDVCNKELSTLAGLKYHTIAYHCKDKPWKCDQCPRTFISKKSYDAHKEEHATALYKCNYCDEVSTTAASHKYHVGLHTKIGVFTCGVCKKTFVEKLHYEKHMSMHSSGTPLSCHSCEKSFSTKYDLLLHIKMHKNDKYKCDLCEKVYAKRSTLKDHMIKHSLEPLKCTMCDKQFANVNRLRVHILEHRGHSFKCDVCDKVLSSKGNLRDHKMTHSGVKPYKCDVCDRGFIKKVNLVDHKSLHSGEGRKTYECDICGKVVASLQSLKCHKMLHTGVKPHQCEKCGMTFCRTSVLKNHRRRTHFNDGRHKCDVCGRVFLDAARLRNHKITHTGIKPFKCTICEREFFHRAGMRRHVKKHAAGKVFKSAAKVKEKTVKNTAVIPKVHVEKVSQEFVCSSCGKILATKEALKEHEKRHVAKPFKCDECGIEFIKESSYLFHQKIHSGEEEPFKCKICHKVVMSAYSLRQHSRTHSNVKAYKCDKCPRSFRLKNCLTTHKLVHDTGKEYQCTVCLTTLRTARSLKLHHKAMHSQKRPFECKECGKGWVERYMFLRHQRWHRGEKPYICNLCNEGFMTRVEYKCHRDTVHKKTLQNLLLETPTSTVNANQKWVRPRQTSQKPDPVNSEETVPIEKKSITEESIFDDGATIPFLGPVEGDLSKLTLETSDMNLVETPLDEW